MLLLEGANRLVVDNLMEILTKKPQRKLMRFGDYNGSQWELFCDGEGQIYISIMVNLSRSRLKKWGLIDHLKDVYGESCVFEEVPEEEEDMTKDVDACVLLKDKGHYSGDEPLSKSEKEKLEQLCMKYGSLYKYVMVPAFEHFFSRVNEDELFDPVRLAYRDNESMYIGANKDNCAVYYCLWFETEDDLLYGRLFLQEFADAKKHNRNIASAPSCDFLNKERPAALANVKNVESEDPHRLWVAFSLFRKHTDTKPSTLDNTVDLLLQFRNYVDYHISCSHAYIHSRMRSHHNGLLKVLARAKTNQTDHVATQIL